MVARRRSDDVQDVNLRHTFTAICVLVVTLLAPGRALAVGGNYVFDGGTPAEQAQVREALDASAFDWSVVPAQITVHIREGVDSDATRGELWLDADLLDSGRFSWGVVQHEYAHQVDFFLFTPQIRASAQLLLGATTWWQTPAIAHSAAGGERFASTLAWTYWPSKFNCLRPKSTLDEAAALPPRAFRSLIGRLLVTRPR
jgi:hypothetical protein